MIEPTNTDTTGTETTTIVMDSGPVISSTETKTASFSGPCPACGGFLKEVAAKKDGKDWIVTCENKILDRTDKALKKLKSCGHSFKLAI